MRSTVRIFTTLRWKKSVTTPISTCHVSTRPCSILHSCAVDSVREKCGLCRFLWAPNQKVIINSVQKSSSALLQSNVLSLASLGHLTSANLGHQCCDVKHRAIVHWVLHPAWINPVWDTATRLTLLSAELWEAVLFNKRHNLHALRSYSSFQYLILQVRCIPH